MYRLQLPVNYCISPSFHVSLLRLIASGPLASAGPHNTPLLPWTLRGPRRTPSAACWTHGVVGDLSSTCSPARGTVPKSGAGYWRGTSWTVLSFGTSTGVVPTDPLSISGVLPKFGGALLLEQRFGVYCHISLRFGSPFCPVQVFGAAGLQAAAKPAAGKRCSLIN